MNSPATAINLPANPTRLIFVLAFAAFALLHIQGLETPVTLEEKDQLLIVVLKQLSDKTGVKCLGPESLNNQKLTIFAKDKPASELLKRIQSVLGCVGETHSGEYFLRPGDELKEVPSYCVAEEKLRESIATARLSALSRLATGDIDRKAAEKSEDPAIQWALPRANQAAFRVAALCFRVNGFHTEPITFMVAPPPKNAPGHRIVNVGIDESTADLAGSVVTTCFYRSTGELRAVPINGAAVDNGEFLTKPYLFARPPKELAAKPFAKLLQKWETPIDSFPSEMLSKEAQEPNEPVDPGYSQRRFSISEELEEIYRRTGIPIVSTSFRTPALAKALPQNVGTKQMIEQLSLTENCFLRAEDGYLLVRHPAYWLLASSEPPEGAVLLMEKLAKDRGLTLDDYANFAFMLSGRGDPGEYFAVPPQCDRWMEQRGILTRFDAKPIEQAFPGLYLIGALPVAERQGLYAGKAYGYNLEEYEVSRKQFSRWVASDYEPIVGAYRGPLFGATCSDRLVPPARRFGYIAYGEDHDTEARVNADMEARFLWVEGSSGGWSINLGFDGPSRIATTIYNVTFDSK